MIKVKNGIVINDPMPHFLFGLEAESLIDLSWTDPDLGVNDCGWWPVDYQQPEYEKHAFFVSGYTYVTDTQKKRVLATPVLAPLPPEVIAANLVALKEKLANDIDNLVAQRIADPMRFKMGYERREAAALSFQNAGYSGDATEWVMRYANAAGKTAKEATDIILSQAAGMRAALTELENLRMDKFIVYAATTVSAAEHEYAVIADQINAVFIP